jgi:uncharacterized protein (UPF0276 family)
MNVSKKFKVPQLGIGLGFRFPHFDEILESLPPLGWFEIISETFMQAGGKSQYYLEKLLEHYPIVQHGVSLSIGSTDPLDFEYLKKLKALAQKTKTPWVSDHLCWTKHNAHHMHNLIPLPYTTAAADLIAEKAHVVQDFLELPLLLENVSSYVNFTANTMTEWEFLTLVTEKADCGILLDINNIFVSAFNHEFDAMDYIRGIPMNRVLQVHLAGHDDRGSYILDSHDQPVRREVWALYQKAYPLMGDVAVMLERDDHIPPFQQVYEEIMQVKKYQKILSHA